jgi:hypothetical protein
MKYNRTMKSSLKFDEIVEQIKVERMKSGENLAMFTTMVAFIKKAM